MVHQALNRTRQAFFGRIATLLGSTEITEKTWEEIETLLIQADVGVVSAQSIVSTLQAYVRKAGITRQDQLQSAVDNALLGLLPAAAPLNLNPSNELNIVLIVGVNGSGKTTTAAKLGKYFRDDGWKVMLAAADTFRAAAVEQLQTWGDRLGLPVITGQTGGDPGAVLFDASQAARSRGCGLLLVDTAGRLHTKYNLMQELEKMVRVAGKTVNGAPHEVWLVQDGTTGQNAMAQARQFSQTVGVTGAILTKLDSTSRGGVVFALGNELGIPIRFMGVGEGLDDLMLFDSEAFVRSLWR